VRRVHGFFSNREQYESPTLYLLDFPLDDVKLRRVDVIIGRIHRQEWSFNLV
jgi:hypothetical protein